MAASAFSSADAKKIQNLTDLITSLPRTSSPTPNSPGPNRTVYPNDDSITALLQTRSRFEHPYTRLCQNGTEYVVVNPLRSLGSMNEEFRRQYQDVIENSEVSDDGHSRNGELQPSVYELAGRVWMLMSRRKESQSVVYHGLTNSGKSTTSRHFTTQILHLSAHTKAQKRLSDQITYLMTLLESFGHSKTPINPSASQFGRFLELHFSSDGEIAGAKVLPFGLNKSRLGKLQHEERSFHVFYQFLAGASPEERESLNLEDASDYQLLSRSGCYRLPGGPFSDDSTQLSELRVAFANLGFKAKHVRAIFNLLTTILLLSNLTFADNRGTGSLGMTSMDEKARVENRQLLATIAAHLGVGPDDLESVLVNKTKWVRKDLCSMILDAPGAEEQRDSLMRDLYAILFTFVVEMANKKLCAGSAEDDETPELQIVQLDLPGYQSRTLSQEPQGSQPASTISMLGGHLVNASGQNGFDEFSVNFANELLQSYLVRQTFEDGLGSAVYTVNDGLRLPAVVTMDNAACVEMLRGGLLAGPSSRLNKSPGGVIKALSKASDTLKGGEERNEERAEHILETLHSSFGRHGSFTVSPAGPSPAHVFGINHWSGQCVYDASDFVDKNADVMDKQLVDLLRDSSDSFISKLVSGPGLATEGHPLDPNITVEAQVSSIPLRTPTSIINPLIGTRPIDAPSEWPLDPSIPHPVTSQINATLSTMLNHLNCTRVWTVSCIRPNDSGHANSFDKRRVKAQVKSLLLADKINRKQVNWIADYPLDEMCARHGLDVGNSAIETVEAFVESRGWTSGVDYQIGQERIWMTWSSWREQEDLLRSGESRRGFSGDDTAAESDEDNERLGDVKHNANRGSRYGGLGAEQPDMGESEVNLLIKKADGTGDEVYTPNTINERSGGAGYLGYRDDRDHDLNGSGVWSDEVGVTDYTKEPIRPYSDTLLPDQKEGRDAFVVNEKKGHISTEVIATTPARRWWLRITWFLTWWIPSFLLVKVGKMKRADIRMAWREKVAIFMMVIGMCGTVVFYIVIFGRLLCPDNDKAWNPTELSQHAGDDDYYAAIRGKVYDFTNFYKGKHGDVAAYPTTEAVMLQFAGQDLTNYFPMPMNLACPELVPSDQLSLMRANFTPVVAYAVHTSGALQTIPDTKLDAGDWYTNRLMPSLKDMYKGDFVYDKAYVRNEADGSERQWAIYKKKVYDLSDYLYTVQFYSSSSGTDLPNYSFINEGVSDLFSTQNGQDITKPLDKVFAGMSTDDVSNHMKCFEQAFYVGELDFRKEPRCTVQNYLLLTFSIILMTVIGMKFLAALQLGSKRQPEMLDKFVICQVPCYTEGEESLKKTIDSLAVLNYDDKRKLIFIICDGNIIGSGNNRPTPRIVLDILGVDPKLDPEPLLFKSIGDGSKQLNYAKVYSGLYEHEGHVVPYVVVVKVGKPTETSKPGNRGKRDSQVLLLQYLNRVHFDAPMSPLELEIYHQMRNIIGIDPTFYEYIFQVDADTTVMPDSLNRLVACTSDDSRIIGICGETKLANERESLTTMIQVYEYYISHNLTKAFESLFGSVTCLPGCFSVYRIRTADKGRPIIISSLVIDEYAEPNVDTLHKKNLFSLGEDRYLTTLMMKHFPTFKMKFTPDAIAHTVAPSRWGVLLSQRRRWINSTVHNLAELLFLPELCGFCFFSMRFVVFIDLLGTIILPATCVYLIYLIVIVSIGKAAIPVISLVMIAAVYGLQAIIFILRREFMLIGWMFVYILAFPVYSLYLPLYSFWSMDDFSWGNTRKVVGEGNNKTVVYEDDEPFHDSMIPYKSFREYEANAWETQSLQSEKSRDTSQTSQTRPTSKLHPYGPGHRAQSLHSSVDLPPGADFWRDSSPLGPKHSSRNLRQSPSHPSLRPMSSFQSMNPGMPNNRIQSMAGMSMWGPGSERGDGGMPMQHPQSFSPQVPYLHPMMTGSQASYGGLNPFASPAMSEQGLRPPTMFTNGPYSGAAPRNSVMSGLGNYGQIGAQDRMSSYSLATTANPFGAPTGGPPLSPTMNPEPSDEEILDVLKRHLATQDLMSVTKRQTREALFALFPNANLQARTAWVNESIDKTLSGP